MFSAGKETTTFIVIDFFVVENIHHPYPGAAGSVFGVITSVHRVDRTGSVHRTEFGVL